ncbi:MAG: TerC family protein [Ignavibacterium sp.]|jgi:predicted tellurium resistance membrane protein TerC|nr:TerC family protein [Ignavibacterium sp.]
MEWITDPQSLIALLTLTLLEIVLGIDNIIFISILSGKLPHDEQKKARLVGLSLAMITRILLLFSISLIVKLTEPLFTVFELGISGRDLILILGGLFLLAKSTMEIHSKLEGQEEHHQVKAKVSFVSVIIQILLLDIVFSLDSVITAIGMANELAVMVIAVIIAVIFMMFFSGSISDFVEKHPTIKILALSFLLLIGFSLIVEGLHQHIPKGYIYFAMAFSVFVEMLNLKMRKAKRNPIKLRKQMSE